MTFLPPRTAALLAACVVLGAACGSGDADTATTDPSATEAGATADTDASASASASESESAAGSTLAGVEAAQWSDNVTITVGADTFRFVSDGIPSHELPDEFLVPTLGSFTPPVTEAEVAIVPTSIAVVESPVDVEIPLVPEWSDTPTDTSLGTIGVIISGAQLFNDYEDQNREFVAIDDNFSIDGVFFADACNGHPLALQADGTGSGDYHYHGVPYCITDDVDADGAHSTILGFLLDGYPVYGPQDEAGTIITSADLDECSGHVGATPEFPDGIYHYHLTEDRSPYSIDCYHGVVDIAAPQGPGGERPEGP